MFDRKFACFQQSLSGVGRCLTESLPVLNRVWVGWADVWPKVCLFRTEFEWGGPMFDQKFACLEQSLSGVGRCLTESLPVLNKVWVGWADVWPKVCLFRTEFEWGGPMFDRKFACLEQSLSGVDRCLTECLPVLDRVWVGWTDVWPNVCLFWTEFEWQEIGVGGGGLQLDF